MSSPTGHRSKPALEVPTGLKPPRASRTLSFRLVAIFVVLMTVVVSFISAVTVTMLQHFLINNLDDELQSSGQVVATQIITEMNHPEQSNINLSDYYLLTNIWDSQTGQYLQTEAISSNAQKQYGTPTHAASLLGTPTDEPITIDGTDGSQWRAIVMPVSDSSQQVALGTVLVARPMANITHTVALVTQLLSFVSAVLVAIGGAATAWLVRRELKPLRSIETVTHAIAAGDLSQRVPHGTEGSEIGNLANSINVMLSQIEQAFEIRLHSEAKMRQFVSDASHELRTPLATVRGYAELYRLGGVPNTEMPQTMDRIESESKRMTGLVEDLLQLARLDEGRPLDLEVVDVTEICYNAVSDFHVRDMSRTASVVGLTGHSVPDIIIVADRDKVTQVVSNLLSNVLMHTPEGTPCEVAIGWGQPGEAVIEIRDHGPGISEKDASRLFERFYRADYSRSRASGGSGLGMAIVAAIMASHGGTARLAETDGGGLTVRLTFPVNMASQPIAAIGAAVSAEEAELDDGVAEVQTADSPVDASVPTLGVSAPPDGTQDKAPLEDEPLEPSEPSADSEPRTTGPTEVTQQA